MSKRNVSDAEPLVVLKGHHIFAIRSRDFGPGWLTSGWGQPKSISTQPTFSDIPLSTVDLNPTSPKSIIAAFLSTIGLSTAVIARLFGLDVTPIARIFGVNIGKYVNVGREHFLIDPNHDLDVVGLAMSILTHATETMWKIGKMLPPTLLISLCYRILVLHTAARFIPAIKRAASGWDEVSADEPAEKSLLVNDSFSEERAVSSHYSFLVQNMSECSFGLFLLDATLEFAGHNDSDSIPTSDSDCSVHPSTLYVLALETLANNRAHLLVLCSSVLDNGSQVWWR